MNEIVNERERKYKHIIEIESSLDEIHRANAL